MFTRPFRFERAGTLADACAMLRRHGEGAKVIAGGQSLMPLVNLGLAQPEVVIDISRAGSGPDAGAGSGPDAGAGSGPDAGAGSGPDAGAGSGPDAGAREISAADGYLHIGALVTHARLAADPAAARLQPLLGAAAGSIGNPRVRNRGTLGGSLAHGDPAAELPLVMVALGASYQITDGRRPRQARAEEFHLGYLTTGLADDELIAAARVPVLGPGWGWSFHEVSRRDGDFALAAVAALVRIADGIVVESRVAAGGVADRPVRLADVEIALSGASPGEIGARLDGVGPLRGIRPVSDTAASAGYRARLCRVLVGRALAEASARSLAAA
jgi:carbon-monoxide dehydrogenase medium subunit